MTETIRERYGRWRLDDLLVQHPGLRIVPSGDGDLTLSGDVAFRLQGPAHDPIEDSYAVEIRVPPAFPAQPATARETGGRIRDDFHKLEGNYLCLAAPTALRLALTLSPTLPTFVDAFVIPYLFGHSYFAEYGVMPFGELDHGSEGIRQYLADLFRAPARHGVEQFVFLASMGKRHANKRPCPCGSGKRLGRCHHLRVNELRDRLGRWWFREEYASIQRHLGHLLELAKRPKMSESAAESARECRRRTLGVRKGRERRDG